MVPRAIPMIKQAVRGVHSADAAGTVAAALAAESASAVRDLLAHPTF